MTQRFGGLFSVLNQRDYSELSRIVEEESIGEDYDFSSMTKKQIIDSIDDLKDDAETTFEMYRHAGGDPSDRRVESMDQSEIDMISNKKANIATLSRIKRNLQKRR